MRLLYAYQNVTADVAQNCDTTLSGTETVNLLEMSSTAAVSRSVWSHQPVDFFVPQLGTVIPDSRGGSFAEILPNEAPGETIYINNTGAISSVVAPPGAFAVGDVGVMLTTAFSEEFIGLVAFDSVTGAVSWTKSGDALEPVAGITSGGLAVANYDLDMLEVLDGNGITAATMPIGQNEHISHWSGDMWGSVVDGAFTLRSGPAIVESLAFAFSGQGNPRKGGSGPTLPRSTIFLAVDPLSVIPQVLASDFRNTTNTEFSKIVTSNIHIREQVTSALFRAELARTDADSVAFIGHSTRGVPDAGESVGIRLWDKFLMVATTESTPGALEPFERVDRLKTSAKVVFVAACWIGDKLNDWWQLPSTSALIAPEFVGGNVDSQLPLNRAAEAWKAVLRRMAGPQAMTAVQAVNDVNTTPLINDVPQGEAKFILRVVRGNDVKIR
jgi:hypothetical protein